MMKVLSKWAFSFIAIIGFSPQTTADELCDRLPETEPLAKQLAPTHNGLALAKIFESHIKHATEFYEFHPNGYGRETLRWLCGNLNTSLTVDLTLTPKEFELQQRNAERKLYHSVYRCTNALVQIKEEISKVCTKSSPQLIEDAEALKTFAMDFPDLLSNLDLKIDPERPVSSYTNTELQGYIDGGVLSDVATEMPYYSMFGLGVNMMPKYEENGDNEGFQEASFFGLLRLDNRWRMGKPLTIQSGIEVAFYSAPIGDCNLTIEPDPNLDTNPDPDPDPDPEVVTDNNEKNSCEQLGNSISSLKFKDISNTVNASVYNNLMFNLPGYWEMGPGFRYGFLSREKIDENGDSVNQYWLVGVEIALNEYLNIKKYKNGIPRFTFNLSIGENEDFAGSGLRSTRTVAYSTYRIFSNQPVIVGLLVNGGNGPDSIVLNLTYGFMSGEILNILNK